MDLTAWTGTDDELRAFIHDHVATMGARAFPLCGRGLMTVVIRGGNLLTRYVGLGDLGPLRVIAPLCRHYDPRLQTIIVYIDEQTGDAVDLVVAPIPARPS